MTEKGKQSSLDTQQICHSLAEGIKKALFEQKDSDSDSDSIKHNQVLFNHYGIQNLIEEELQEYYKKNVLYKEKAQTKNHVQESIQNPFKQNENEEEDYDQDLTGNTNTFNNNNVSNAKKDKIQRIRQPSLSEQEDETANVKLEEEQDQDDEEDYLEINQNELVFTKKPNQYDKEGYFKRIGFLPESQIPLIKITDFYLPPSERIYSSFMLYLERFVYERKRLLRKCQDRRLDNEKFTKKLLNEWKQSLETKEAPYNCYDEEEVLRKRKGTSLFKSVDQVKKNFQGVKKNELIFRYWNWQQKQIINNPWQADGKEDPSLKQSHIYCPVAQVEFFESLYENWLSQQHIFKGDQKEKEIQNFNSELNFKKIKQKVSENGKQANQDHEQNKSLHLDNAIRKASDLLQIKPEEQKVCESGSKHKEFPKSETLKQGYDHDHQLFLDYFNDDEEQGHAHPLVEHLNVPEQENKKEAILTRFFQHLNKLNQNQHAQESLWGEPSKGSSEIPFSNKLILELQEPSGLQSKLMQLQSPDLPPQEEEKVKQKQQKLSKKGLLFQKKIYQNMDYYNEDIINNSWNKPKAHLNHILIDLNDPSLFIENINSILSTNPFPKIALAERVPQNAQPVFSDYSDNEEEQDLRSKKVFSQKSRTIQEADISIPKKAALLQPEKQSDSVTLHSLILQKKNNFLRTEIQHSQIAKAFRYNNLRQNVEDFASYHKYDLFLGVRGQIYKENQKYLSTSTFQREPTKGAISVHNSKGNIFSLKTMSTVQDFRLLKNPFLSQKWLTEIIRNPNNSGAKKHLKSSFDMHFDEMNQSVDSYDVFKDKTRLSCKRDTFVMLEYIEENPLIMSNYAMNSKIYRFVYDQRVFTQLAKEQEKNKLNQHVLQNLGENNASLGSVQLAQKESIKPKEITELQREFESFKQYIKDQLGSFGTVKFLSPDEQTPLIGQIVNEDIVGVSVIENKMFRAPIFKQKCPETDFLLIKENDAYGNTKLFLRKIEFIYVVGQIEPIKEIFPPHSRNLSIFIRNCITTIVKLDFRKEKKTNVDTLKQMFPKMNEHQIRKIIQQAGGRQDSQSSKEFVYNEKEISSDVENQLNEINIEPEEVCQYEKMQNSVFNLKKIGINELRSQDKMKIVLNRYIKQYPNDIEGYAIAKFIWDELNLTSWNLSGSFVSKQKMYLTGSGDPTGGNGGYNYVKRPLKTRADKDEIKDKNKENLKSVKKSGSDLRLLKIEQADDILVHQFNQKPEHIKNLKRWNKITLIKKLASEQKIEEQDMDAVIKQYARDQRITTKMANENYQKQINTLFQQLISLLSTDQKVNFDYQKYLNEAQPLTLDILIEREKHSWEDRKKKFKSLLENTENQGAQVPVNEQDQSYLNYFEQGSSDEGESASD